MAASAMRPAFRALKWTSALAALGVASGTAALTVEFGPDVVPRLARSYSDAVPAFLAYRKAQFSHEDLPKLLGRSPDAAAAAAEYARLHAEWAPRMLAAAFSLRGFYLKGAQLVAANYGNAFPPEWQKAMEPSLDKIPHRPFSEVKSIVEAELGGPLELSFSSFEEEPFASASIGQVHRATLRSDGRRVAVKVQDPASEAQFRGDVAVSRAFFKAAMPEYASQLDEIERQFAGEFDYRREAAQLDRVRRNLAEGGFGPEIAVPEPVMELCTKRVLTMKEIVGAEKLTTALEADLASFAAERGITPAQLIEEERRLDAEALARGELRCGPDAATMDKLITYRRWRNRLGWLVGLAPVHIPLNHARLVNELFRIHGHEIFVDGYFNGDPHPGNLLVVRAPDGDFRRLALVDYGQVKSLPPAVRTDLAKIILALARARTKEEEDAVGRMLSTMGLATERNDPEVLFKLAQLSFDRDDMLATAGRNIMAVMADLGKRDPTKAINEDMVMVARCSLMLRGLGHMLGQHRSGAKMWEPFAERVLRERGVEPEKGSGGA
ncbi:ABC1 family-domain-containing protein [Hyaloraphidium curvatum]|nr:ABC1 family-domain-containing protein [Hyaloraphidium curvatum]